MAGPGSPGCTRPDRRASASPRPCPTPPSRRSFSTPPAASPAATGFDRGVLGPEAAALVVTTQAAERIYRRSNGTGEVSTTIDVAAVHASTGCPRKRSCSTGRRFPAASSPTSIRRRRCSRSKPWSSGGPPWASASATRRCLDSWRIRRGGTLVFADSVRFDGDATAVMAGGATGNGATAFATVMLIVAPRRRALRRAATRGASTGGGEAGVSACDGMLVARMIAPDGRTLRTRPPSVSSNASRRADAAGLALLREKQ